MKINHENIFIADIYKAENLKGRSNDFEFPTYTPVLKRKNIVVIKYKDYYVPVYYMEKLINRLSIKFAILTGRYVNDKRFLSADPACATFEECLYVDNIEPASKLCVKATPPASMAKPEPVSVPVPPICTSLPS